MNYIGPKNAMIIGAIPYVLMVLSFLKPGWYTSLPAHALVGFGASILWTGEGVYLSQCAAKHSKDTGDSIRASTSYYNGLFYSLFNLNGTTGLAMSALILMAVGDGSRDILYFVLSAMGITGVAIFFFVPTMDHATNVNVNEKSALLADSEETTEVQPAVKSASVFDTLNLIFGDARMALVAPILVYTGMSSAFLVGDFTRFAGTRMLGPSFNPLVLAAFYLSNTIFNYYAGRIAGSKFGRWGLVISATIIHAVFLLFFSVYKIPINFEAVDQNGKTEYNKIGNAEFEHYAIAVIGAILFAAGDAVWHAQPVAILQTFFRDEPVKSNAAMACLKLFQSLGNTVQFALGFFLKDMFQYKVLILIGCLTFAYCALYILHATHTSIDSAEDPAPAEVLVHSKVEINSS